MTTINRVDIDGILQTDGRARRVLNLYAGTHYLTAAEDLILVRESGVSLVLPPDLDLLGLEYEIVDIYAATSSSPITVTSLATVDGEASIFISDVHATKVIRLPSGWSTLRTNGLPAGGDEGQFLTHTHGTPDWVEPVPGAIFSGHPRWGIDLTGATDSYEELQEFLDEAVSTGKKALLTAGTYTTSQTLRIGGKIELEGIGTAILGGPFHGNVIHYQSIPTSPPAQRVAALLTGGDGYAWMIRPPTEEANNWHLAPGIWTRSINGYNQLSLELTYKHGTTPFGDFPWSIGGFGGKRIAVVGTPVTRTAYLEVYDSFGSGNKIRGTFRTSVTGEVVLNGSTIIATGNVYHLALTYDGSTVRLFVNGVQEASAAATGTVVHPYWALLQFCGLQSTYPVGGEEFGCAFGSVIDGVRIRGLATYTSNFTPPTAKHDETFDPNTYLICNFNDWKHNDTIHCQTFIQAGLEMPFLHAENQFPGTKFKNLKCNDQIDGYFIYMSDCPETSLEDIKANGRGLCFANFADYLCTFLRCTAAPTLKQPGLVENGAALNSYIDCQFIYGCVGAILNGSQYTLIRPYCLGPTDSHIVSQSPFSLTIIDAQMTTESSPDLTQASIVVVGTTETSVKIQGGGWNTGLSTPSTPALEMYHGRLTIERSNINVAAGSPEMFLIRRANPALACEAHIQIFAAHNDVPLLSSNSDNDIDVVFQPESERGIIEFKMVADANENMGWPHCAYRNIIVTSEVALTASRTITVLATAEGVRRRFHNQITGGQDINLILNGGSATPINVSIGGFIETVVINGELETA